MTPDLPCYSKADTTSAIVRWLKYKEIVQVVRVYTNNVFAQIQLPNNTKIYCEKAALCSPSATIYAETIEGYFLSALPGAGSTLKMVKLVDVRQFAPNIQVYPIFATDMNFLGIPLYERDICLLQEGTLNKLLKAQERFAQDGYSIKLYDGYRPYRTTMFLGSLKLSTTLLASPTGGSNHNQGAAVDMTLVDKNGIELEMPSFMHTMDLTSSRDSITMTESARRNMDYMTAIMVGSGFASFKYEWWHFTDLDKALYPVVDINLGAIRVIAKVEKPNENALPFVDPKVSGYSPLAPTPSPVPTLTPATTVPGATTVSGTS